MNRNYKICYLLLVSFLTVGTYAQSPIQPKSLEETITKSELFLTQENEETKTIVQANLTELIESLQEVRNKEEDDATFLRKVFIKTNRKELRRYSLYSTFAETMQNGNYGCLSGTILYSLILSHFNFDFEAIELADHVYLVAKNKTSTFIFESTLGSRGFISNKKEVDEALSSYNKRSLITESMEAVASAKNANNGNGINNKIGLTELAGLQFYNEAIRNFKNTQPLISLNYAVESHKLYPSIRIKQLMQILINEILYSEGLSEEMKEAALNNYIFHIREKKISQTK